MFSSAFTYSCCRVLVSITRRSVLAIVISPIIRIPLRYKKLLLVSSSPISIIIVVSLFYYVLEYRVLLS
jgi:hypothetical protein